MMNSCGLSFQLICVELKMKKDQEEARRKGEEQKQKEVCKVTSNGNSEQKPKLFSNRWQVMS